MVYALKHEGTNIKLMTSAELVAKFPESLISFLERQIEWSWPQQQPVFSDLTLHNGNYVSACTNQGVHGIRYLLSRNDKQFVKVMRSNVAAELIPDLVVQFLESKLDLNVTNAPPNNKIFGNFLEFTKFFHSFFNHKNFHPFISKFSFQLSVDFCESQLH